ncbi:glycerol kinase [Trichormus variabilis ATCC 29413]|uniref:Glycerol kinase n=2 Tax=Anabaena variabilis TaxID=264691 RepID=GLPK_TRIV2|nr:MULTISPECIES: glycerol kinase GlpK [Nostocaceae]Q3M3M2.1 RecName: Full=Glycerol kinase; AltName: Full=ATP:glycerol 3-phosphotransferase; AltName: Full=Glycerokinase; Short=GK [Trichormus variabilis ATCC 29413]ABA24414.1 glycerol kinase [Trichormus variabilis ATCC 29413]MBC1214441.1 glycerol kinase GlpK [Trichormus variabilis ARAD]MBC1255226.1 glycerol kinase GlpK [Trichormus variabilis V5]MBC1266634.1 glycerol kinase GlpK [Trichormus variabilis FSR]MBC1301562.1 glycerol kinase GlpK [Tricho
MQTSSSGYILALDLGTTGNRAFIFNNAGKIVAQAYKELTQHYPQPGWLEHDAEEIWQDTCWVMKTAIANAQISPSEIAAIGLTVQRETCLLWDKTTGKPLHKAIVWQDRRTAPLCHQLQEKGYAQEIYSRTGLVVDAYFSATKLRWLLDYITGVDLKNVLAGTIDTWILWKLTGGKVHATDHSNASRTMLMNLKTGEWDEQLLEILQIPAHILPQIQPSLGKFGLTDTSLLDTAIPITAILGDQQAALFGHGCDRPGLMKCTYGTGSFLVAHTGSNIVRSQHQLISTIAWTQYNSQENINIGYALEGSMFTSGACIQWLRDGIKLIKTAAETETMANQVDDNGGVYFVPAFSGLGAPYWDMNARGAFFGITASVQPQHLVRAVLEAIAYQVLEVVQAINASCSSPMQRLIVDGGACENNFLMQFQADVLGIPVERPTMRDTTVQGAAFAAGLAVGFWDSYTALVNQRQIDRIFEPGEGSQNAIYNFATWQKAVKRSLDWV